MFQKSLLLKSMAILVVPVALAFVYLFLSWKRQRIRSLRWPDGISHDRIGYLTKSYLKERGWKFEISTHPMQFDYLVSKGDIRYFLAFLDRKKFESRSVDRLMEQMESDISQLRGRYRLPVVYVTSVLLSETLKQRMFDRNIVIFHFSGLDFLRNLDQASSQDAGLIDQRQLKTLVYFPNVANRMIDNLRDKKDWDVAVRVASMSASISPSDSYAHKRLAQIYRMAEASAYNKRLPCNSH